MRNGKGLLIAAMVLLFLLGLAVFLYAVPLCAATSSVFCCIYEAEKSQLAFKQLC